MCILCRVMVWKCICCCNLPKSVFPTLCRSVPLEAKLSDRQREYSNSLYSAVYPIIFSEKTACWAAAGQPACLHILPDKKPPRPCRHHAGKPACRRGNLPQVFFRHLRWAHCALFCTFAAKTEKKQWQNKTTTGRDGNENRRPSTIPTATCNHRPPTWRRLCSGH